MWRLGFPFILKKGVKMLTIALTFKSPNLGVATVHLDASSHITDLNSFYTDVYGVEVVSSEIVSYQPK